MSRSSAICISPLSIGSRWRLNIGWPPWNISILSLAFAVYLLLGMTIFVAVENDGGANKAREEYELKIMKESAMKTFKMSSSDYDKLFQQIQEHSRSYTRSEWTYENGLSFVVQVVTTIGGLKAYIKYLSIY